MSVNVGINGLGRIGRLALRILAEHPGLNVVAVNDPGGNAETFAHLLNFDSVHGIWQHEARAEGQSIVVNGQTIRFFSKQDHHRNRLE